MLINHALTNRVATIQRHSSGTRYVVTLWRSLKSRALVYLDDYYIDDIKSARDFAERLVAPSIDESYDYQQSKQSQLSRYLYD